MKSDLIIIPSLSYFTNQENGNSIKIAPIRFESDPITGFFLECPDCKSILTFHFSELYEDNIECFSNNCKFVVDVEKIKVKLNS